MWKQGVIGIKDSNGKMNSISYCAKCYKNPSQFGINGGRISKLMLKHNGKAVYSYDRGEDIKPQTVVAEQALAILMLDYN